MSEFQKYQRTQIAELRDVTDVELAVGLDQKISVSEEDRKNGSPRQGDKIARNPKNHDDQWLVSKEYVADNFEKLEE